MTVGYLKSVFIIDPPIAGVAEGTYEYRHGPLTLGRTGDPDRYGFLTSGSTLSATSTENRTSPIRRGVWVMERMLETFRGPRRCPRFGRNQKRVENESGKLDFPDLLKLHSSQTGCSATISISTLSVSRWNSLISMDCDDQPRFWFPTWVRS